MDDTAPLYALIHIPKAAGKTLRWIAKRQYDIYKEVKLPKLGWQAALAEHQLAGQVSLISDVPMVGMHERLEVPVRYITMLRHPVQRVLSFYRYAHPDGDFSDFRLSRHMRNNGMTRALAGVPLPRTAVTPETLRLAEDNLHTYFDWIGISEQFDESIVLAKHLLGWRNILYHARNVSMGRNRYLAPPPRVIQAIEEDNVYDMQIYAIAHHLLNESIASRGLSFRIEVEALRRMVATEMDRSLHGGVHQKPPRLEGGDYRRHVKGVVAAYRTEHPRKWRRFQKYVQELTGDWRR